MSGPILFSIAIGLVFLGGAAAGWAVRGSVRARPARIGDDELLAVQLRNEMLRVSARTAHQRAAEAELDREAALAATAHLEIEVDRLTMAFDEATAEADAANAWVRKVWRERAIGQGAPQRHPSARVEERATPPESAPRPIATVRRPDEAVPPRLLGARRARWN